VVRLPVDEARYYLIESRQLIGPDRNLPAHGVLIYECDDRVEECRRGRSPVKLINADPSIPHLEGAPFSMKGKKRFDDRGRNLSIELIEKRGMDYKINVSYNP
jgi:hypothetical protein